VNIGEAVLTITADSRSLEQNLARAELKAKSWSARVAGLLGEGLRRGMMNSIGAIASVTTALGGLATAAVKTAISASSLEGIMDGFAISAAKAGMSYDEFLGSLTTASRGMVRQMDLMRLANEALTGATGEFAKEFGQALPTLLRAAQVSARRTGKDVTFLFESLVTGVKRSSPQLVDNTGIVLKMGAANEELAASLGKTVEELTDAEKQFALLRATMKSAQQMIDETGDTTLTNAERIQQLRARFQDIRDEVGLRLQPALSSLLTPLYSLASNLLPQLADAFTGAGGAVMRAGGMILEELSRLIGPASDWGRSLGQSFANGIASTLPYLIGVIRAIGRIVEYWFKPGSPPRIARQIDKWGRQLVQEYFRAFEDADLTAVESFGRQVGQLLETALGYDIIKRADVRPILSRFRGALKDVFKELQEGGEVSEETWEKIREISPLGPQLERLAKRFVGVPETLEHPALATARGLDQAALAAKRAAEAQWDYYFSISDTEGKLAMLRQKLAETEEGSAEYWNTLKQIAHWEKVLQEELEGTGSAADDAADSIADLQSVLAKKPEWGFELDIEQISERADQIAEDIFQALKPAMDKSGGDLGVALAEALRMGISTALFGGERKRVVEYTTKMPGFEGTEMMVEREAFMPSDATWEEIREELETRLGSVLSGAIRGAFSDLSTDRSVMSFVGNRWQLLLMGGLLLRIGPLRTLLGKGLAGLLRVALTYAVTTVGMPLKVLAQTKIGGAIIGGIRAAIASLTGGAGAGAGGIIGGAMLGLTAATLLPLIFPDETRTYIDKFHTFLNSILPSSAREWWPKTKAKLAKDLSELGRSTIGGFVAGVEEKYEEVKNAIVGAVSSAYSSLLEFLGIESPSTLFAQVGRDIMAGLVQGIEEWYQKTYDAVVKPISDAIATIRNLIQELKNLLAGIPSVPPAGGAGEGGGNFGAGEEGGVGGGGTSGTLQTGSLYWGGGWAMLGERGPELVRLPRGAAVFPTAVTERLLAAENNITVSVGPVTVQDREDIHELAWRVAKEIDRRTR